MKKSILFVLVILLTTFIAACNSGGTNSNFSDYSGSSPNGIDNRSPGENENLISEDIFPMFYEVYNGDGLNLYILLEEANLYYTPSLKSGIVSATSWKGAVVDVFARVEAYNNDYGDGGQWILARKANFAESDNNIGWIFITDNVKPLTEELAAFATDHIMIAADCIDEVRGMFMSEIDENFDKMYFGINSYDGDMVELFTTGGAVYKIEKKYIVYPRPFMS